MCLEDLGLSTLIADIAYVAFILGVGWTELEANLTGRLEAIRHPPGGSLQRFLESWGWVIVNITARCRRTPAAAAPSPPRGSRCRGVPQPPPTILQADTRKLLMAF